MDEGTKRSALSKSKSIKPHIGYPQELLMDEKLNEYYDDVRQVNY